MDRFTVSSTAASTRRRLTTARYARDANGSLGKRSAAFLDSPNCRNRTCCADRARCIRWKLIDTRLTYTLMYVTSPDDRGGKAGLPMLRNWQSQREDAAGTEPRTSHTFWSPGFGVVLLSVIGTAASLVGLYYTDKAPGWIRASVLASAWIFPLTAVVLVGVMAVRRHWEKWSAIRHQSDQFLAWDRSVEYLLRKNEILRDWTAVDRLIPLLEAPDRIDKYFSIVTLEILKYLNSGLCLLTPEHELMCQFVHLDPSGSPPSKSGPLKAVVDLPKNNLERIQYESQYLAHNSNTLYHYVMSDRRHGFEFSTFDDIRDAKMFGHWEEMDQYVQSGVIAVVSVNRRITGCLSVDSCDPEAFPSGTYAFVRCAANAVGVVQQVGELLRKSSEALSSLRSTVDNQRTVIERRMASEVHHQIENVHAEMEQEMARQAAQEAVDIEAIKEQLREAHRTISQLSDEVERLRKQPAEASADDETAIDGLTNEPGKKKAK